MFRPGHRGHGRPLLGAAVVVGASRSAAKHEVQKQEQRNLEMQVAADKAAEKERREEEERDRRTQLAIDEAFRKERNSAEQADAEQHYAKAKTGGMGRADQIYDSPTYFTSSSEADEKKGETTHYCPECRNRCKGGDKFCNRCGCRQPTDIVEQRVME